MQTTSFNGINTLAGVTTALRMQLGYGANGGIDVGVGAQIGFAAGSGQVGAVNGVYNTQASATGTVAMDFNNDGILDLAVGSATQTRLDILLGNGNGTFRARVSYVLGVQVSTNDIIDGGDVNGDGNADIVVGQNGGVGGVYTLLGNGDGTFRAVFSSGGNTGAIKFMSLSDMNGDGIADVVYVDPSPPPTNTNIAILFGNGDGSFGSIVTVEPMTVSWRGNPLVYDFNGDGKMDIAAVESAGFGMMNVYLGNGDGTFLAGRSYNSGMIGYYIKATMGDYNGDGIMDVFTGGDNNTSAGVLLGNRDGSFRMAGMLAITMDGPTVALKTADLNADSFADVISFGGGSTNIMLSNGDGTFRAAVTINGVAAFYGGAVADFSGDGISDILVANNIGATADVYLGTADSTGRRNNKMAALDLTNKYGAKQALTSSRAALARIASELGNLGAMQSRLSVANQTLLTARENFDSARSQLVDADVAQDSAKLVSTKIKQQAATSVLAQANQQPSLALQLLKI